MQFTTMIAAFAALAMGNAAAIERRDGARLAQFRVFGAAGCHDLNYGFYTVDQSDADTCKSFPNIPDTGVKSLNLEALNAPAANGCNCKFPLFFLERDSANREGNCLRG